MQLINEIAHPQLNDAILNVITVGVPNITQWENEINQLLEQYKPVNTSLSPVEKFMQSIEEISEYNYNDHANQSIAHLSISQNLVTYNYLFILSGKS